jgi:Superinfection immunity protein
MDNVMAWGLILLCAFVYLVPAIVAVERRHHNADAIAILNIFLGWTFIGWVVALVWACTAVEYRKRRDRDR